MKRPGPWLALWALENAGLLLFAAVLAGFGLLHPRFLEPANLLGILVQSAPAAIVAVGMTFVLLTGGVDLSVGAVMFVGAALAGRLLLAGHSPAAAAAVMLAVGLLAGSINAFLVTRLRLLAFVATLGLLNVGRGLGLWISQTRAMNLPDGFSRLGSVRFLEVPLALWVLALVVAVAHVVLTRTPFGRQLYAIGHSHEAARKAGIPVRRHLATAYLVCGGAAGLGGMVALAQLGAVSPRFGEFYEFDAITAAVLGGVSLFGGRGGVFPGPILGAVLVKSIFNGLVMAQADPYLFPLITGGIIFAAVLVDALRDRLLARLRRRPIYLEASSPG
jgi:ribose transport system permease protein